MADAVYIFQTLIGVRDGGGGDVSNSVAYGGIRWHTARPGETETFFKHA